ncbi:MAG: A/G-specific adenine glycosylase [Candidatus Caldatribacterium sp.]|nr:A/G-specific adenine glycosylase [Candidatus Caldatribacterium sp.]
MVKRAVVDSSGNTYCGFLKDGKRCTRFVLTLLSWFESHARDLPWRKEYTPYRVWIAEVMLSQTQVRRVAPYYVRFLERFPDVAALASAPLEAVLLLWEGLGYYRRALDVHRAAQIVRDKFNGEMPRDYADLRNLPGIGPYIASAILAIGYNEPVLALETNGRRVIARFFGFDPQRVPQDVVETLVSCIPKGESRSLNQAMMDFGALVCTSRNPKCVFCPLQEECASHGRGDSTAQLQKRLPKHLFIALCCSNRTILLEKSESKLFPGLYVLPWREENDDPVVWIEELGRRCGFVPVHSRFVGTIAHAYTKYKVFAKVFQVLVERSKEEGIWVLQDELSRYPLASLFRKALRFVFPKE